MSNIVCSDNASPAAKIQTRRATEAEIDPALAFILGAFGQCAPMEQVLEFREYARRHGLGFEHLWITRNERTLLWAILPVMNPGRTALLLSPDRFIDQTPRSAIRALIDHAAEDCEKHGMRLAQALIDPARMDLIDAYAECGFRRVAELHYLQTAVRRPPPALNLPKTMRLETYSADLHALFARTILSSYEKSLDCPQLSGLQDIDDIIAGHQAAGEFNPKTWYLLHEDEEPLAVLLLNRVPQNGAMELVYLGLATKARGRGIGRLMMQQALTAAWESEMPRLTLAVDSKNIPALKLYYRQGMERIAGKAAMVRDLRPS